MEFHDIDILFLIVYNHIIVEYHEKRGKNMIIAFAGHRFVASQEETKKRIKSAIREIASSCDTISCYCGGYGEFDNLCASASNELKKEGFNIETVLVTPYLTLPRQNIISQLLKEKKYDTVIYPPLEKVPPRFAISKRNEWMIKQADAVIVYINHTYGGAYNSFLVARRNKKRIINVYEDK